MQGGYLQVTNSISLQATLKFIRVTGNENSVHNECQIISNSEWDIKEGRPLPKSVRVISSSPLPPLSSSRMNDEGHLKLLHGECPPPSKPLRLREPIFTQASCSESGLRLKIAHIKAETVAYHLFSNRTLRIIFGWLGALCLRLQEGQTFKSDF